MAPRVVGTLPVLTSLPCPKAPSLAHLAKACMMMSCLLLLIYILKVWINSGWKKVEPGPPVMLPHFAVTSMTPSLVSWLTVLKKCIQVSFLEIGIQSKMHSVVMEINEGNSWNDWDARMTMPLLMPAICNVISGDAWHVLILKQQLWCLHSLGRQLLWCLYDHWCVIVPACYVCMGQVNKSCLKPAIVNQSKHLQVWVRDVILWFFMQYHLVLDFLWAFYVPDKWWYLAFKTKLDPSCSTLWWITIASVISWCLNKVSTWSWVFICHL